MMPSPADISLVWDKISPNRSVPRSQETPCVCLACAPVCQHYYKPQTDPRSACFNHWAPTKNTCVVFQIRSYFSIAVSNYFAWAPHPEEGLPWQAGCPQSQTHKWGQIQSRRSEVHRWSDRKVRAGTLQLHAKPQSLLYQSGNQQITEISGQETHTKCESHWYPHQHSLANPSLEIGLTWWKCRQIPPYSAGRRHTGL